MRKIASKAISVESETLQKEGRNIMSEIQKSQQPNSPSRIGGFVHISVPNITFPQSNKCIERTWLKPGRSCWRYAARKSVKVKQHWI